MINRKILNFFVLLLLFSVFVPQVGAADDNFNPNYIISDVVMLDYDAMSLNQIQSFLESKNSYLANYSCKNTYGEMKKASEIIYDASNNNYDCSGIDIDSNASEAERKVKCKKMTTINPQALIVMLQKEMGLIENTAPTQKCLDIAMGYGCPDSGGCSSRWKGFGKQVNSAALQFKDYMDNPHHYTYKAGNSYVFNNQFSTIKQERTYVRIDNSATAGLYNYTPHVYNGNYNFYIIWNRYFKAIEYPDGSLLQAKGEPGIWLIEDGMKRPFLEKGALLSRFDINKTLIVDKSVLDGYERGSPIKFPNYSILRSPMGNLYLLVDDKRRGFASSEVFKKIGFNPEEIVNASWEDVKSYEEGPAITSTSRYPTGALLQDKNSGGVYWVYENKKAPLLDAVFLKTKFKNKNIITVDPKELEQYEKIGPIKFESGELLTSDKNPAVYLITDGIKRSFVSGEVFEGMGYKWANIITVPDRILNLYKTGKRITSNY